VTTPTTGQATSATATSSPTTGQPSANAPATVTASSTAATALTTAATASNSVAIDGSAASQSVVAAVSDPIPATSAQSIGVLTSGGDAPGMNAALRAIIRTALQADVTPYAIHEGYQGLIDADPRNPVTDEHIKAMAWSQASGILNRGGTFIGTFRSKAFETEDGMLTAAWNLLARDIDRLVVIGGDGSLTGLALFAKRWPDMLTKLVDQGKITADKAKAHPRLMFSGLVGSIDNDFVGTDMTIGVDSALHRIQDAIDAIASTAASHQRSFVIEVMGRNCGYLALASAVSGGCDYVLIPEDPPAMGWETEMIEQLQRSRQAGRKDSIVIVAEGARDQQGQPISAQYVCDVISQGLPGPDGDPEETRVTILGHVQRGGTPSAYDRWASTWLGYTAACAVLDDAWSTGYVFGFRGEKLIKLELQQAVADTHSVRQLIDQGDYAAAMALRGDEFADLKRIFTELTAPPRSVALPGSRRIGIMHAGALSPGMNTAAKTAVWQAIARGYTPIGIRDGFVGLADRPVSDHAELTWAMVDGWNQEGGAMLGTRRHVPVDQELERVSAAILALKLDGILVIGGGDAYDAVAQLERRRADYGGFRLPLVCVPASIDNNLPDSAMSIGCDGALNVVVDCIDKTKLSASASHRCFVVETMGRYCGYLALMGGFAGGAEQAYLNESGVSLDDLSNDIAWAKRSFANQQRNLFLAIRNEQASPNYSTEVIAALFGQEGEDLFDTRTLTIGHIQQGGAPTPADRLLAVRLTDKALTKLIDLITGPTIAPESSQSALDDDDTVLDDPTDGVGIDARYWVVGSRKNQISCSRFSRARERMDLEHQRPRKQWWLGLTEVFDCLNRNPIDLSPAGGAAQS
jgi:6-phosphofructokinase 1